MPLVKDIAAASSTEAQRLELQPLLLQKSALVLRAVNHPLRQQMLHLMHQHGQMTVTELYTLLNLEQSVASQHLAILRRSGFATALRHGKFIHYSVNQQRLQEVQRICHSILGKPGDAARRQANRKPLI